MGKRKIIIIMALGLLLGIVTAIVFVQEKAPVDQPEQRGLNRTKEGEIAKLDFDLPTVDIKDILGEPIGESTAGNQTLLKYETEYKAFPNQILVEDGSITLIKEQITPTDDRFKSKIQSLLPFPTSKTIYLKIYEPYGNSYPVHIYPEDGVAFVAHASENIVTEIWHFKPTTIAEITNTWGKDLLDPEEFATHEDY